MKKLVIKIIISVFIIACAMIGITFYNSRFKNTKAKENVLTETDTTIDDITSTNNILEINTILYDINKNIIVNDKLDGDNKSLFDLLNENYKIRYEDSTYGVKLLDMESIKTDFKTTYLAIYVDGKYSSKGVSYIELHNGIIIEFKETKL